MELNDIDQNSILIKPHHLLDYLYDLAINYTHEDEINFYGNNNGILCRAFIKGLIKKITFTPFADDICRPCKKLINGQKCSDTFDEVTTKAYGINSKDEFNYQLDIKLNTALPDLFKFDIEQATIDVLYKMQKALTEDIINLYLWKRPERYKKTLEGIVKAIEIYK